MFQLHRPDWYSSERSLHMDSYFGPYKGCDFGGGITDEDNFVYYFTHNPAFRCTSSLSSTNQYWLGSFQFRLRKNQNPYYKDDEV